MNMISRRMTGTVRLSEQQRVELRKLRAQRAQTAAQNAQRASMPDVKMTTGRSTKKRLSPVAGRRGA